MRHLVDNPGRVVTREELMQAVWVDNPGRVVTREELMQAVWGDVFVTDDRITQCVTEIRRALGAKG